MHSLYPALTGIFDNQGIKKFNIFYDSIFINLKVVDVETSENVEYLIIEKIDFSYDENRIKSDKNFIISFGNTFFTEANITSGSGLVDSILLNNKKEVLICGLSSFNNRLFTSSVSGGSLIPIIYKYDINKSSLDRLYPKTTEDIYAWATFVAGEYETSHTPIVFFDDSSHKLNYVFKTTLTSSTSALHTINNISFDYQNELILSNVSQLTSLSINNNFSNYDFVNGAFIDSDNKIMIMRNNNNVQLFNLQ